VIKSVRGAQRAAPVACEGVHVLRHTFCSRMAMEGATIREIQELAGHADCPRRSGHAAAEGHSDSDTAAGWQIAAAWRHVETATAAVASN
jgi:integrase